MKIALHDADKTNFHNLALMKLSAFHKKKGDDVYLYQLLDHYDIIYSSKVFVYKPNEDIEGKEIRKGGIGYRLFDELPDEIEHICPDYSLYDLDYSLGFLTRGCSNKCSWCVVPFKEGNIRKHADIEEFLQHNKVLLMDNNVLAHPHGIEQIKKLGQLNVKVDFNQGIDARLIDNTIAKMFKQLKWLKPVRLSCDNYNQMETLQKAVKLLRWQNVTPRRYFVYCMIGKDIDEALERVKFIKGLYCEPFVQPCIDYWNPQEPSKIQKQFTRWVNHTAVFNSVKWEDYRKNDDPSA